MTEFKRESRYIVFKLADIDLISDRYIRDRYRFLLNEIGNHLAATRREHGKAPFNAVVVEQDWPEFDPVWSAIEARMTKGRALEATTQPTGSITTDPTDPRLGYGVDDKPVSQNAAYLVLSEDELAKGFVRPLRQSYKHVGVRPKHPTRPLTEGEQASHQGDGYVLYETYPESERPKIGKFWTARQLESGCGFVTTMTMKLCETYARNPKFYGATYCVGCSKHLPVDEFVWVEDGEVVGS